MKSQNNYQQSLAPVSVTPRAMFDRSYTHKTTIDFDYLYPVHFDEINPNETVTFNPALFGRLASPYFPIMDNMYLEWFSFWIPMRLIWDNTRKFFGEQTNPGDSIDYTIPYCAATASTGYTELSLADYFALPTKVPDYHHIAAPFRCYSLVWNHWFRDQNLQNSVTVSTADGAPDTTTSKVLLKRGKRFDYFTSLLTSPQKSTDGAVSLPLGTSAPIYGTSMDFDGVEDSANYAQIRNGAGGSASLRRLATTGTFLFGGSTTSGSGELKVDLTEATAATIIELRTAMAVQSLLELDSRAGTRYSEIIYSTYGCIAPDISWRPEFLGSGSSRINVNAVPQTSNDGTNGSVGKLGAMGTVSANGDGSWTKSFTEHGYVLTVAAARADITYQQGLQRTMSRSTRYDFLYPILQNIGDQPVYIKEIYTQNPTTDTGSTGTYDNDRVFGYAERYAELKYNPNRITGLFRSNCTSSLEAWHLSEEFASLPGLNSTFITSNTPVDRAIVNTSEPHLLLDCFFEIKHARPMQVWSIPGMGARF